MYIHKNWHLCAVFMQKLLALKLKVLIFIASTNISAMQIAYFLKLIFFYYWHSPLWSFFPILFWVPNPHKAQDNFYPAWCNLVTSYLVTCCTTHWPWTPTGPYVACKIKIIKYNYENETCAKMCLLSQSADVHGVSSTYNSLFFVISGHSTPPSVGG